MQVAHHQEPRGQSRRRPSANPFEIVDTQVHLNRVAAGWNEGALPDTLEACVAVMDAVGVDAVLIDERWGSPIANDDRHIEVLPNGAMRYHAPFGELAATIVATLPKNPERTVALRKLLEAKDCAVRALLFKSDAADAGVRS